MSRTGQPIDDEFAFIRDVSEHFHTYHRKTLVPSGDDAAVYLPGERQGQIVCVDTLVEGIHFKRETLSPSQIGYKSLAVNLSDIAAMGGQPKYFLVSVAIPAHWSQSELHDLYLGMKKLADTWQVDLLGGDTVASPEHLVLSVTAIGEVDQDVRLLRSNAGADDVVFVTGTLGDSAAGLDFLLHRPEPGDRHHEEHPLRAERLLRAHQWPEPHIQQGRLLAEFGRKASIALNDVSDGIASEAHEIAVQSRVDLILKKESLPLSPELKRYAQASQKDPYEWALFGGEDFVLIGTVPLRLLREVQGRFQADQLAFYPIGTVRPGEGSVWLESNGSKQPLRHRGFNHFHPPRK